MSWDRIRHVLFKELRQAFREPRMRVLLFVPPLLQLIIFGFAVNLDVEHGKVAWLDNDGSPHSRELYSRFGGSPHLEITHIVRSPAEAQRLLDGGAVQMVVAVPPGFGRDLLRGTQAQVQILLDGSNSNTAGILANYAGQIVSAYGAEQLAAGVSRRLAEQSSGEGAGLSLPSVAAVSRVWFNSDLRSRNYYVPAVIVNILLIVTTMLTALAIVREKEIGTIEQLMVTPLRPAELMIGKMLPFGLVGLADTALITTLALLVFHVPFRGSGLVLLVGATLFLLTTLGIGLFLSTVSHTQQQAMMGSFFFVMPATMLSGFAFPIRNMPVFFQYLSYLDPMRYFVEVVRGVFLKGSGFDVLWPQLTAMLGIGTAITALSAARFHKRLD